MGRPRDNKLTIKQEVFVEKYVETGNATEASMVAYDTENREVAKVIGSENLTKPYLKKAVEDKRADLMQTLEAETKNLLKHLLNMSNDESIPASVRSKVCQDLLDRAGYTAKKEVVLDSNVVIETRHTADLAKRARDLLQNMEDITPEIIDISSS